MTKNGMTGQNWEVCMIKMERCFKIINGHYWKIHPQNIVFGHNGTVCDKLFLHYCCISIAYIFSPETAINTHTQHLFDNWIIGITSILYFWISHFFTLLIGVTRYNFFFLWQDEITSSPTAEAPDILSSSSSSCETSQVDDDSAVDIRSRAGSVSSVKVC